MEDFPIYFSDLNEDAQKRLLEFVGESDPKEMNWDIDMCPLAYYPAPDTEGDWVKKEMFGIIS